MNIILFDSPDARGHLLPLTFTRPVADIRCGIMTISEKWKKWCNADVSYSTQDYLSKKFPAHITRDNYWINGCVCPNQSFVSLLHLLQPGDGIYKDSTLLAVRTHEDEVPEVITGKVHHFHDEITMIDRLWKIFHCNGPQIRVDYEKITAGRTSAVVTDKATVNYHPENVFIEEGVSVKAGIINAEAGPIYLGKDSQIQEGAVLRGPFAILDRSIVNMGGKMRGDTTIGPDCKVGGEISNSVIFGLSNKSHDGFLGNSVLGEWCNIGADTNNSNMKNNYDVVRLWDYPSKSFVPTGLYFCGLILADHSKTGINTMLNTGTVVGVSSNVLAGGFPPNFIPSFSWALDQEYDFEKACGTAERAMGRRNRKFTEDEKNILRVIFEQTAGERNK